MAEMEKMLERLLGGGGPSKTVPSKDLLATLTPEEKARWEELTKQRNEILAELEKLKQRSRILDASRELWWQEMRKAHAIGDVNGLHLDMKNYTIRELVPRGSERAITGEELAAYDALP